MDRNKISTAFLGLSFLLAAIGGPSPAAAQEGTSPRGRDLMDALRQGGYVIYFRHAATNRDQADTDNTKLDGCEAQRNLSAEGRRMARAIGAAFRTLRIPVGQVMTSPYCRAVETAELAFGRHETSTVLYFAIGLGREQRERQSAELRQMLSAPPRAGTNTVIVSHHANLKEATGLWPKREGDANIFRPRPEGGFDHVAEVSAEEWSRVAGRAAPATPLRTGY